MTKTSQEDIQKALSEVMHPEINYSLVQLGMIKDLVYELREVNLTLKLPSLQVPVKAILIESIKKAVANLDSSLQVEIKTEQMSDRERENFMKMAKEGWKF